jgi:polyadenylate-binding protein 2
VKEMEDELDKLNKMQQLVEKQITSASDSVDEKSIYVGQVDYETTIEELRAHFSPCGSIGRITIVTDKITGHPKGQVKFDEINLFNMTKYLLDLLT